MFQGRIWSKYIWFMMIAGLNGFKRSGVSLTVIQSRQSHANTRNPNFDLVFCCLIGRSAIHGNDEMLRMTQCFTLVYRENDLHIVEMVGWCYIPFPKHVVVFWRKHGQVDGALVVSCWNAQIFADQPSRPVEGFHENHDGPKVSQDFNPLRS